MYLDLDKNKDKNEEDYHDYAFSVYKSACNYVNIINISLRANLIHSIELNSIMIFAIELFLKSLAYNNLQTCRRIHNLYKLYHLINNKDQEEIKKMYYSIEDRNIDFELNLKELRNAYQIFRYSYEKEGLAYNEKFNLYII